jgi:hypothetical protein
LIIRWQFDGISPLQGTLSCLSLCNRRLFRPLDITGMPAVLIQHSPALKTVYFVPIESSQMRSLHRNNRVRLPCIWDTQFQFQRINAAGFSIRSYYL